MLKNITPKYIVNKLDEYIIGQDNAKKIFAIALRNRWRISKIKKTIKKEINPKNIIMIGPTGVGKTEISKKLAELSFSPFLKVEATKYTEIGYVGNDVESMIKDLANLSYKMIKKKYIKKYKSYSIKLANKKITKIIYKNKDLLNEIIKENITEKEKYYILKKKIINKELEKKEIIININKPSILGLEIISTNKEDISNKINNIIKNIHGKKKKNYRSNIKNIRKIFIEEEYNNLINFEEIKKKSIKLVEENGIIFIDEIDKICKSDNINNSEISRYGVQRDLLSIVEGCIISTKYGNINTKNILFIAAGSFINIKYNDLIPELQGRFPIKVYLDKLNINDFNKILLNTKNSIIKQYIELLKIENINIEFTKCAINEISKISLKMNKETIDIGARRLYSVIENIMQDILFYDYKNDKKFFFINKEYVNKNFKIYKINEDLDKYII